MYQSYTTSRMSMITAGGTVICQTRMPSVLVPTNTPSAAVKRTDPKMAPYLSARTDDGPMVDSPH
jgi:hypothetical protein